MLLGNGAVTTYEYEPLTRRLHSLRTQARNRTLQALTYEYDPVGNVTGMVNALGQPAGKRSGAIRYPTVQCFPKAARWEA
jgi:YD repeat-containing protein